MMNVQTRELYQDWVMRLSIGTVIAVVLLSWVNEISFFDIMVRAGVSFGVMYLLMIGILNLFEKAAPPKPQNSQSDLAPGRGGKIDFSVGENEPSAVQKQEVGFAGQIDHELSSGLMDSERQADVVRRMGWN